jgi:hypothetical protein
MCKLLIITGGVQRDAVGRILTATNKVFAGTEQDGFGFIASANGKYARGRYFEPEKFRGFGLGLPVEFTGDIAEENQIPWNTKSLIVHGRTATSSRNLGNVHPFMHGHEALAHNGVVRWIGDPEHEPNHECDTEQFFTWLRKHAWHKSHQAFSGWGAIAHIDVATGVLTVARDRAMLYVAKRAKDAGWAMATKKEHLENVCASAGVKLQHEPLLLPDKKILLFNERGAVTSVRDWDGFGERELTYLDKQSWGDAGGDIDERLSERAVKKGRSDRRGVRRGKSTRRNPELWDRGDTGPGELEQR